MSWFSNLKGEVKEHVQAEIGEEETPTPIETTPLKQVHLLTPDMLLNRGYGGDNPTDPGEHSNLQETVEMFDRQSLMTERLSVRLLGIKEDDSDEEGRIVRDALDLPVHKHQHLQNPLSKRSPGFGALLTSSMSALVALALATLGLVGTLTFLGSQVVGPPRQPVGPYQLVERQEGADFFKHYDFYVGRDSAGSNGFNKYIGHEQAMLEGILNITIEKNVDNVYASEDYIMHDEIAQRRPEIKDEPFIYMGSSATKEGPRNSIRLEGKRRFNRGLYIIDLRHMPVGCGVWPAFWLTDELNWPANGEMDIIEGVNYQSVAKTALHSTRQCSMTDVPLGVSTGTWDISTGIPDADTGIPDMTLREARNCFVYDSRQWLNQGCVAVDLEGDSMGIPVNEQGGGVYVLEWDPVNRHIRSWVFSPHLKVPGNIRDAIRTASDLDASKRVMPNPEIWPLPYAYFSIGKGTDCASSHFRNMRLVFNLAFCGSVSGNRFQMDCKKESKKFETCNDYIKSNPEEMKEAYWKVRGVYVYDREWEKAWL